MGAQHFRRKPLAVLGALALAASLMVLSAAAADDAPSRTGDSKPRLVRTTQGKTALGGRYVAKHYSDGSGHARISKKVTVSKFAKMFKADCGPTITDADIERYLEEGADGPHADTGPVPSGPDPCTTSARLSSVPSAICTGWVNESGDDVHSNACVRYVIQKQYANGETLFASKANASAYTDDGRHGDGKCFDCDYLEWFWARSRHDHARIVAWNPSSTNTISGNDCVTSTVSLGFGGQGVSQSQTSCPKSHGPNGMTDHRSGAKWADTDGADAEEYMSADFMNQALYPAINEGESFVVSTDVYWD